MPDGIDPQDDTQKEETKKRQSLRDSQSGRELGELDLSEEDWNLLLNATKEEREELKKDVERLRSDPGGSKTPSTRDVLRSSSTPVTGPVPSHRSSLVLSLSETEISGEGLTLLPETMKELQKEHQTLVTTDFDRMVDEFDDLVKKFDEAIESSEQDRIRFNRLRESLERSLEDTGHLTLVDQFELQDLKQRVKESGVEEKDIQHKTNLEEFELLMDELEVLLSVDPVSPPLPTTKVDPRKVVPDHLSKAEAKVYLNAINKLYYEPLTPEQKKGLSPEVINEDARLSRSNNAIGTEVLRDIETSGLDPAAKQRVHLAIVGFGMQEALNTTEVKTNPNTLLRGNSRFTNYSAAYLNTYGEEYVNSIRNYAFGVALGKDIPPSVKGIAGRVFDAVDHAQAEIDSESLLKSLKDSLATNNASPELVKAVEQAFERQGGQGKGMRPFDDSLKNDLLKVVRESGAEQTVQDGVALAISQHEAKLTKIRNLVKGTIPPQDLPPDGKLLSYLNQHGINRSLGDEDRKALAGVSIDDFQVLQRAQIEIASGMLDATIRNLEKLSPEAREFLERTLGPISDPGALNVASANTLLLRLASPKVGGDARKLGSDDSTEVMGELLERGTKVLQRYVNGLGTDSAKQDYLTYCSEELASNVDREKLMVDCYGSLARGDDLDELSEGLGGSLEVAAELGDKMRHVNKVVAEGPARKAMADAKVEPQLARIAKLEKKLDALNNKHSFERFKAWLGRKDVNRLRERVIDEMDSLRLEILRKVDRPLYHELGVSNEAAKKQLEERLQQLDVSNLVSTSAFLSNPVMNQSLRDYLAGRGRGQDVDFHNAVSDLLNDANHPEADLVELNKRAREISEKYLSPENKEELNFDWDRADEIHWALEDGDLGKQELLMHFEAAEREIRVNIGKMTPFFGASAEFREGLEKMTQQRESIQRELDGVKKVQKVREQVENKASAQKTTGKKPKVGSPGV